MLKNYMSLFRGSLGVSELRVERDEMNDLNASQWLERALPKYWPIYYNAAVYEVTGGPDEESKVYRLVANYKSEITVRHA